MSTTANRRPAPAGAQCECCGEFGDPETRLFVVMHQARVFGSNPPLFRALETTICEDCDAKYDISDVQVAPLSASSGVPDYWPSDDPWSGMEASHA